ncbi:MAG: hypothetical protein J0L67_02825 [Cytophagales bacterium]|nr:hypothetical protein [Cytophagales bacterium]
MKYIYYLLIIFFCKEAKSQTDNPKVTVLDLYSQNFKPNPIVPVILNELLTLPNHKLETTDLATRNAFQAYVNMMDTRKRKRREKKLDREKWWGDYRIAVSIGLSDGRAILIAAGSRPRVYYDSKIYYDNDYNFLILVNSQFDLPDLKNFLREKKVIY